MDKKTAKALYALFKELKANAQPIYEASKEFVDAYEREEHEQRHKLQEELPEREKPTFGEIYRDIFGNQYLVFSEGQNLVKLANMEDGKIFTVPLEVFMNPTFTKE